MFKNNKKLSIRKEPRNLKTEDLYLFEHELKKKFPNPSIKKYKNVHIINSQMKKYKFFRFQIKNQRMNPIDFKTKVKFLFSDLKNLIFSEKRTEVVNIKKATWVVDTRSYQYFHWFTDAMQRINISKDFHKTYPVLIPLSFIKNSFIKESLKYLDIEPIYIDHNKEYLIEELILAERVSPAGNYNKDVITGVSDDFRRVGVDKSREMSHKKIWVSRQNSDKRMINNFKNIEKILLKYNFHIVEFENYSIEEQIRLLRGCDVLGGVHGAGLVNMLFMKPGAKVLEVRARNDSKNNCYFSLASDLDIDYYYFLSDTAENDYYRSNHDIDSLLFESFIKRF